MTTLPSVLSTRQIDEATWTSMAASARLPTGELNENRAIDIIGEWFSMAPHGTWLDKEYSRELLQTMLEEGLREGEYDLAKCAVDAANAGNEIADAALRTIVVREKFRNH